MKKWFKNTERFFNKFQIVLIALTGIIIGILLMAISDKFPVASDLLKNIGQLLITIFSGSLFMEWFGYVNYTRKRMCEILAEDEVIKVLDINRKKELKSALIKNIYMNNAPLLQNEENNISTIIDREMDNILRDYYFEEYIIYMDVSIIEMKKQKFIKKKIRHTFTAKTINNEKCLLVSPINTYLKPPIKDLSPFTLEKLTINGKPQNISNWKITEEDNTEEMCDTYPKHYSLSNIIEKNKKLFTFNKKLDIDIEFTTIVDIDDLVYTHQIGKPCKHFCIHYNAPAEYKILMEGFGFMSIGNSQRQRLVETENGCMLRFLDWILPGNGVMIVIMKK